MLAFQIWEKGKVLESKRLAFEKLPGSPAPQAKEAVVASGVREKTDVGVSSSPCWK